MVLLDVIYVGQKICTINYIKSIQIIKHDLELIALIKNIKLFLDSKESNLNFEHSFVGIHKVLREI